MKSFYVSCAILIFSHCSIFAQFLQKDEALEDLEMLRESIKTYNPALPHYHPEFDSLSTVEIQSVERDSVSLFDYFTAVSRICALSNEGHFSIGNWSDTIHAGIPENRYAYLPVEVLLTQTGIYVAGDYSNEQSLNRGNKILSINGKSTRDILLSLRKIVPSDGHILTYADRSIETGFPWLYYFHIERPETFEIEYQNRNGVRDSTRISALLKSEQSVNYKKYLKQKESLSAVSDASFYELNYFDEYAVLKLPSFDWRRVEKHDVKAKKMYKKLFKELAERDVRNLIIDLRDNTGGRNEFADRMVPYILRIDKDDPFLKKTISWEGKEKTYKMPKASKFLFEGKLFVLVNGKTYSAGNTLARYLKEYGDAIIIGEETGTRYEGFAAGSKQAVTLPNSELVIGIPRYHIFFPKSDAQSTKNRGLMPDVKIDYGIEDRLAERDLEKEKAMTLINK